MDIYEFAMDKERFSEEYYRQLSSKTNNKGLSNILAMLADEEHKHFKVIEQMHKQTPTKVTDTDVLGNARLFFEKMRESTGKFNLDISEPELYEKARDIEIESRRFYLEKSNEVTNADQKEIFRKLAAEEQKHLTLVQSICDFVTRPEWFLENAEMYRFDDYADGVL
jgi:rubrerythrin